MTMKSSPASPVTLGHAGPRIHAGILEGPASHLRPSCATLVLTGDIVRADCGNGFFYVLDRSKEMIKYKRLSRRTGRGRSRPGSSIPAGA